jgi:hypothetical protein
VIDAFRLVREELPEVQLALVGSMATDDPEGWEFFHQTFSYADGDPDIKILNNLNNVGAIEVNAFQSQADVVVQKSLREGFGLTVTEALWKVRPVVAGNVGGIPLQVVDGETGYLSSSPQEAASDPLVLAFGLLIYLLWSLVNGHIARDLRIRARELGPGHLWQDLKAHLALRFHDPENPRAYNIFQKLAYVGTLFVLLPGVILSGLALSPGMDAVWPWLTAVFGGRQSARSVHFIAMGLILGFVVVHLVLVLLAGPINELRSMITGWWRVPTEKQP